MNNPGTRDIVEELETIHYMFRYFLDRKNYEFTLKIMNEFGEQNDINEIKTILIITRSFKNHEILKEPIARLVKIYGEKMGDYPNDEE